MEDQAADHLINGDCGKNTQLRGGSGELTRNRDSSGGEKDRERELSAPQQWKFAPDERCKPQEAGIW